MKKILLMFALLSVPIFATDVKIPELKRGSLIEVKKNLSGNELLAMALVPELVKNAGPSGILFVYEGSRSSIHYVSYDGQTFASYDTSRAPENLINPFHNYSDITSDGTTVYVMWNWNPDPHIDKAICTLSRYDIDGNYRDTIKLDGQFQSCVGLTLLDRDRFILMAEALDGTPFTGVYQTNGQFLHKLTLPNDLRVAPKNKKREDMGSLEVPDSRAFEDIMSFTALDNDGLGNVYVFRRDPQSLRNNKIPQVVFRIDRNEQVTRFQLKQPTSKIGNFVTLRAANDHVISLQIIQDDVSEWAKGEIVVYGSKGKVVADNWYVARDFGFILLGWNEHRALFGTQAGDPNLKVKHFGIIEGLML